jgi:hypothetical protein
MRGDDELDFSASIVPGVTRVNAKSGELHFYAHKSVCLGASDGMSTAID